MTDPDPALGAAVDRLGAEMDRWCAPGLEMAVVRAGDVLVADGFGVRGVEDPKPVGSATWFHHGSCGKAMTGLVAAVLAEHGVLDLDAPVRDYLPEFRLPDPVVADRVTTRDLLCHRGGLGRNDLTWILNPSWTREELVRRLAHLPLAADLRARWLYSNFGYATVGLIIGRATGSTWEDQLRLLVLEPLGMSRTTADLAEVTADEDHARPHLRRGDATLPTEFRRIEGMAPAGGVLSCAEDSARWLLLHTGSGGEAVPAAAVAATHEMQIPVPAVVSSFPELRFHGYGLGWVSGTLNGRPIIWHNGGIDGFRTDMLLVPEERLGLLVSTNLHDAPLSLAAVLSMAEALIDGTDSASWYDRLRPKADEGQGPPPPPRSCGPSHDMADYAGTYGHPGFGAVVVTAAGDDLAIRVGDCLLGSTHRHFDTWDLRYEPLDDDFTITFVTDADGTVAEAVLPLDSGSEPVRFRRQDPPADDRPGPANP